MLKDPFSLTYHLMPACGGWLNDPNGLCQFNGTYHIFYQYALEPDGSSLKCWGHYTTKDFIHYKDEGIALYPDEESDQGGVYSGCAYVNEEGMHLFYTGNVKLKGDHDYIHSGRLSNTNYVFSKDGIHFSKKETVLDNSDYPSDLTCHIRDPKVYQKDDHYVMYLGARTNEDTGCILIYESADLKKWKYKDRITSKQPFGYMWECPDCFTLNDETFLITCPQGIKQTGYKYENSNQNGYFKVHDLIAEDYETLDHGYDFYAPQSFTDTSGRRILIGWMGIPDDPYQNPTVENGWQMALTLPRELTNVNGKIYQYPIKEISELKQESKQLHITKEVSVINKSSFIKYVPEKQSFTMQLNNLKINYNDSLFTLEYLNDLYGRKARNIEIDTINEMEIFIDHSSIEIFLNHGEKVMTCRYYDDLETINISSEDPIQLEYACMNPFIIE